jgi:hypothetical protein
MKILNAHTVKKPQALKQATKSSSLRRKAPLITPTGFFYACRKASFFFCSKKSK